MCFLREPFQHDLFVSYSHGAFKGQHDSDLKRWSQKFAKGIRSELAGSGEFDDISVFLDEGDRSDENVDRAAELTELLRERVRGSALFALLMTPQYLKSKWCLQELDWWCEKHHPDTIGAGGRIFPCRVRPTEQGAWPKPIKDVVGYFCYDRNKEPDRARPFTYMDSTGDLDDYKDLLVDVTGDMMQRLRTIKTTLEERRKREAEAERLAAEVGQVIYLHARHAHAEAWQRTGDSLVQNGFVVLPSEPAPIAREPKAIREIAELRVQTLIGCDGVLLVGTEDGRALDADLVVVGRQDRHTARAISERLLPCAVLNTDGAEIATRRRKDAARALGIEWIDTIGEIWPSKVKSWLNEASAAMGRA